MRGQGQIRSMRFRSWAAVGCSVLLVGVLAGPASAGSDNDSTQTFDFDTGNALFEVIYPTNQPLERLAISESGHDAPLIVHFSVHLHVAFFDAIAPYHPTAVGLFSDLGRRPESEHTTRNRNIAVFYAAYRVLSDFMPQFSAEWRNMLTSVGLDPDDDQENATTPIGLGNLAARKVIEGLEDDGMNRRGTEGGAQYDLAPYADYTGYQPVNTAYELSNPSRWQPAIVPNGNGTFFVQTYANPQLGQTDAFTFDSPREFRVPRPRDSLHFRRHAYKRQADQVLAASAALTDEHKMESELFFDKFLALGAVPGTAVLQSRDWDIQRFVEYLASTEIALFDSAVVTWFYKTRYDAVRPFSAVRHIYGDRPVTAWGGPGKGTVDDLPASEWQSYLPISDHPEYPSGSSALCYAYAEAARLNLGTDDIDITVHAPAGSSMVEPGVTPATDLTLSWDSWSDYAEDCRLSRFRGGVHFLPATEVPLEYCNEVARRSYDLVQRHLAGDV